MISCLQIILFLNNQQKTTFRYFIWNINDISIGKLIGFSFVSGLIVSSLLNKTLIINSYKGSKNLDGVIENEYEDEDDLTNIEENYDSYDIPPERDVRDPQPTISVKYRVIKNNDSRKINNREKKSKDTQIQDDWNENMTDW